MWNKSIDLAGKEFILLRQPNAVQFELHLLEEDANGCWIFSDFSGTLHRYRALKDAFFSPSEFLSHIQISSPTQKNEDFETSFEVYIAKVEKAIRDIKADVLQKVVLSRTKMVDKKLDVQQTISDMAEAYPQACVFAFNTKKTGFWLGATPEQLLACVDGRASAASLAGTKLNSSEEDFTEKERDEQQWVTAGIVDVFKEFGLSDIQSTPAETKIAGPVKHLFSVVSGKLAHNHHPITLAKLLHPTPAIGGYPLKKSVAYIEENELYNREFYTGFFGFADDENCSFWVNLRCMQLFENRVVLYAGGGITAASQPNNEWEETERKFQTLLRVIKPKQEYDK